MMGRRAQWFHTQHWSTLSPNQASRTICQRECVSHLHRSPCRHLSRFVSHRYFIRRPLSALACPQHGRRVRSTSDRNLVSANGHYHWHRTMEQACLCYSRTDTLYHIPMNHPAPTRYTDGSRLLLPHSSSPRLQSCLSPDAVQRHPLPVVRALRAVPIGPYPHWRGASIAAGSPPASPPCRSHIPHCDG